MRTATKFMFALVLVLAVAAGAAGGQDQPPAGLVMPEELPKLDAPVLITTLGQSPEPVSIRMLCQRAGVTCFEEDMITAEQLEEKVQNEETAYKTMFVTMGTSLKGMGEAGIEVNFEVKRVNALIAKARELGIFIVGAQISGLSRRTDETDEQSNHAVAPQSDMLVIRSEINYDDYFTDVAAEEEIPIVMIEKTLDFEYVLKVLFGL